MVQTDKGYRRCKVSEILGLIRAGADMIEVKQTGNADPFEFDVRVSERKGETRHRVTMTRENYDALTRGACAPERCIEAAFRFLLDREPKESILARFDVTVISRYFPEFESELARYIAKD
jgi:hypothetical protein